MRKPVAAGVLLLVVSAFLLPALAFAQSQENFQVVKTPRSENFVIPYTASNRNEQDPLVYTFDQLKQSSWIISIQDNMSYIPREGVRTIIKIEEPAPSEKFIELGIYGDESKRYWVAVNTPETGYARMYDSENGWSPEQPLSVAYTENSGGLTVTNGQRIVVDRLDIGSFAAASILVYGNDKNSTLANAYAGDIAFQVLFGSFEQSPLYVVPIAIIAGIFGIVAALLIVKKRKPSD
jgi:hypothetical protein